MTEPPIPVEFKVTGTLDGKKMSGKLEIESRGLGYPTFEGTIDREDHATGTISFQVRRKGGVRSVLSGRPGWLYIMPAGFVRFELGNDKLMWWVTQGNNRDKKAGEAPVPKDGEDVRIEIAADAITHTIGAANARIPAAELGFPNFSGGQFRFRGPISVKGLSPRLR